MQNLDAPHLPLGEGITPPGVAPWPPNATAGAIEHNEADNRVVLPASTAGTILEDTVVLFELDGREYRVPARPRAAVALRYLRAVRDGGPERGSAQLLTDLLGADGFDALCDYEDLSGDQLKAIMDAAQKLTLGAMEDAFGGNSRGSKR
jgi:hypothetical protein